MVRTSGWPLIAITGPTAVGKTAVGVRVAECLGGQIVSVDSRQVFRGLDIGTAKPTVDEQARVRHHLIDVVDPHEPYSAGQFGRDARRVIEQLAARDTAAVLVGGSGLYLEAVLDGFSASPADPQVRAALLFQARHGAGGPLYEQLGRLDPVAQARLAPADTHRVLRALERARGAGGHPVRPPQGAEGPLPGVPLVFCLCRDRDELYSRIDGRVGRMVAEGLVAEVQQLLDAGFGRETPALGTMGYREIVAYLAGECSLQAALAQVQDRSRRYAKRQLTWFRRDRRMRWLDLDRWGEEGVVERILAQVHSRAPRQGFRR